MTPPRKPGRWTWAVVGRLCSRTVVAVTLLWLVALIGWPERHSPGFVVINSFDTAAEIARLKRAATTRDADLRVLWEVLFPPQRVPAQLFFLQWSH